MSNWHIISVEINGTKHENWPKQPEPSWVHEMPESPESSAYRHLVRLPDLLISIWNGVFVISYLE